MLSIKEKKLRKYSVFFLSIFQKKKGIWRILHFFLKSKTIDALMDNISEVIGEIELHTIVNVLKNCTDRVGYCIIRRGSN